LLAAKAVKGYQPDRGASLDTHVFRQLQALQRIAPQIHDPMPLPERLRRDRGEVSGAIEKVQNDLGRDASDEEVAQLTNLPRKRITKVRQMMQSRLPLSSFEESEEDSESDQPDLVANQMTPEDEWMDAVYHDLGDIDRVILQHRTGYRGNPVLPNQEIAKRLRMSPAAVSQRATRIQQRLDEFHAPN
jgi:DNA-directed RNA polymerase specialized sigma subunit